VEKARTLDGMLEPRDQIVISQLEISTFIGATDEEQKRPQRLRVSIAIEPERGLAGLGDELANTMLLKTYPIAAVELELRKYILPDTEFVAVRIRREQ
jgi:hypothetical protein